MFDHSHRPRLLLSGCAGHAGRGVGTILAREYRLRGLDIRTCDVCDEMVVGSVADIDACGRAMRGVEALVTCHMGRQPAAYQPPFDGIDINIRGTLNLYHTAVAQGVKRVVQVSSACMLPPGAMGLEAPDELPRRLNPRYGGSVYALTKAVEEMIAGVFFDQHRIVTTTLRPSWVVCEADGRTKYDKTEARFTPELIDPLDLGEAVLCCLRRAATSVEGFVVGQPEYLDVKRTMETLGWAPRHRFDVLRGKALEEKSPRSAAEVQTDHPAGLYVDKAAKLIHA